jgi:anti-sigma regulatory factor (Ser/Thr protein kinase)
VLVARAAVVLRGVPVRLVLRLDDHVQDLLRDLSLLAAAGQQEGPLGVLDHLRLLVSEHGALCGGDRHAAEDAFVRQEERVDLSFDPPTDAGRLLAEWEDALTAAAAAAALVGPAPPEVREFAQEWRREVAAQLDGGAPSSEPFPRAWAALRASGLLDRSSAGDVVTVPLSAEPATEDLAAELVVDSDPAEVRKVRRWLDGTLAGWSAEDLSEVATFALSEVLTNAILHAPGDLRIRAELQPGALHVAVWDRVADLPDPRRHTDDSLSGRGLELVEAMVSRWGVSPLPDGGGKAVWFEVDRSGPA